MANTQEIVEGFQNLTQEQRMIAQQLNKVDSEKSEHAVTIEALKDVCLKLIRYYEYFMTVYKLCFTFS